MKLPPLNELRSRIDQLPRPVRRLVFIGLLPIPGPVDEICLVLAAVLMATVYRRRLSLHISNFVWGAVVGSVLIEVAIIGLLLHSLVP